MPKMKTHRGAKKRFKVTGSGKITRRKINKSHILEKKSPSGSANFGGPKSSPVATANKPGASWASDQPAHHQQRTTSRV